MKTFIKPKEREAVIRSLKSGVVPRIGLHHIQVGRSGELKSFIDDVDTIADGGSAFRFVIGEYGSGKTFFLSLVRSIALERGLATMHADLSPTKRLHGSDGQPRLLLSEMLNNLSTRTKPEGNALKNILERYLFSVKEEAERTERPVDEVIARDLSELNDYTGGHVFIEVIKKYWKAYEMGDENLLSCVQNWLKAGYSTKSDSLKELGIRDIITDSSFYNTIKLYAVLVKKAGYKGLLICLDEMVNLYKIPNSVSRKSNYEEILCMLNDNLQGSFSNLGFIMCGTPEFLTDKSRGLYSYEALKSRLEENNFSRKLGVTDYNSVVLRLASLTEEELYLLLFNILHVYAHGDDDMHLIPEEGILAFLNHCADRIGAAYFRTPRTTIKGFIDLLSILEQYPQYKWSEILDSIEIQKDIEQSSVYEILEPSSPENSETDEFASFTL